MRRIFAYVQRDLIRWRRTPLNIISTLAMPAAWLIFLGFVMPVRYDGSYLDFVTPGILVLTALTAGLAAGSSLMFDKTLGYLNKFLAVPAPRESILYGKILFVTFRGVFQALIILIMAVAVGASVMSAGAYIGTFVILAMFCATISALGTTVALYLPDHDTYAAFQAILSMPLYFASTALIPMSGMTGVLKAVAVCNPLTYAMDAIRGFAAGSFPATDIAVISVFMILMLAVCGWKFRKVTLR